MIERVGVGVGITNSPGEEVLSTFLDVLLPVVDLTDLITERAVKMSPAVMKTGWQLIRPF